MSSNMRENVFIIIYTRGFAHAKRLRGKKVDFVQFFYNFVSYFYFMCFIGMINILYMLF